MAETHQIQSLFLLTEPGKHLLDLLEVCKVAREPFYLSILAGFLLDRLDSPLALVLLSIGHDHPGAVEYECAGYLIPRPVRPGTTTAECLPYA
jgi:hypothetical protein